MGSLCSSEASIADITTVELKPDGTSVEHKRTLTKESKLFIKKTQSMLSVIIPACKQILHDKEEADMLRQICAVLDKVAAHYHEEFTAEERQKLLLICVPQKEIRFKAIVETYKPGEKIRQSRADVDLMRIIRLWFEADKDNSGELEMAEVGTVLNTLGISINQRDLKTLFAKVDTSGDGSVQFDEFYELYTDATTIAVVKDIFSEQATHRPSAEPVFDIASGQQVRDLAIDMNLVVPPNVEAGAAAGADLGADGRAGVDDHITSALLSAASAASPTNPQQQPQPQQPQQQQQQNAAAAPPLPGSEQQLLLDADGRPMAPPPGYGTAAGAQGGQQQQQPGAGGEARAGDNNNQENVPPTLSAKEQEKLEKERKRQEEKERKEREKQEKKEAKRRRKEQEEQQQEEVEEDVNVLSFHDCHRFLREVQQMEFEPDAAAFVVANFFGEMRVIDGIEGVASRQFQNSLVDPVRNSWFNPKEDLVTQDMSQPLSHYYIDSSFNTYLTGNQLSSPPSTEMFREALREGCRYIELDVWDGPDGDPIVCLNPQAPHVITFDNTIRAIAENAFYSTPYPVLISIELHTTDDQQERMSALLMLHLGEALINANFMEKTKLTSPEFTPARLLRKFLVKTKKIAEQVIDQALDEEVLDIDKAMQMAQRAQRGSSLSKLCAIEQRRLRTLGACKKWPHYTMVTFDETKADAHVQNESEIEQIAELSKKMFFRTYPKGLRYDSSNQLPINAWSLGCQVVAMNYQTLDYGFRLNRAKFAVNGHCGYVLKPRCLRLPSVPPNVYGDRMLLTVEIVCGVQLPRSLKVKKGETEIPDPYVELWISGAPCDDTSAKPSKTRWIENNTFNPKWGEKFQFLVNSVELAILTVRVMDRDINAIIAEGVCSVRALRPGYRAVPLWAENGTPIPAPTCLFVKIDMHPKGTRVDEEDL